MGPLADFVAFDARLGLIAASAWIFWPTIIFYRIHHNWRHMPLLLSAVLAACFIWIAENIGTYSQTWLYPNQRAHWSPVGFSKFTSWYLLQIVSYALVALFCRPKPPDDRPIAQSIDRLADRKAFNANRNE